MVKSMFGVWKTSSMVYNVLVVMVTPVPDTLVGPKKVGVQVETPFPPSQPPTTTAGFPTEFLEFF